MTQSKTSISALSLIRPIGVSYSIRCFQWTNKFISSIKTVIVGPYHGLKESKYVRTHLAETQCRFNRRCNWEILLPILSYTCLQNNPRGLKWIKAAESCC
jgi:hypothetical protein